MKTSVNPLCWCGCGESGTLTHCWGQGSCKVLQQLHLGGRSGSIHSFHKYFLSTYCVLGMYEALGDIAENKRQRSLPLVNV